MGLGLCVYAGWPRFIHGRARGKQVIREITFFFIIFPLVDLFRKKFEICHLALKIYADHLESKACFLSCPIKNAFVAFHFPEKGIIYIFLAKNWVLLSTGMAIFISSYLSSQVMPSSPYPPPEGGKNDIYAPLYISGELSQPPTKGKKGGADRKEKMEKLGSLGLTDLGKLRSTFSFY